MSSKKLPEVSHIVRKHLEDARPKMSAGQFALEVLDACVVERIAPPGWVLKEISACYSNFKCGARPSGNLQTMLQEQAPRTLGEAFGVPDIKKAGSMSTRRKKALIVPWLTSMFAPAGGLKRTPEGYAAAACAHGITVQQVKDWLPKTRSNKAGHKPYPGTGGATNQLPSDPFGRASAKEPKVKK